ncbi:hypothetical protein NR798_24005 [Archangium gephyra]|uniref:hypothetical protein n=1 Tax=Archangium gephyra TaxID=48 RepID=UPI0035D513C1
MFAKPAVIVCFVTLFLGACGGGAMEETSPESIDSVEQPMFLDCSGRMSFIRDWFQNGVNVGSEVCQCDGTITKYGTTKGTYTQEVIDYCW